MTMRFHLDHRPEKQGFEIEHRHRLMLIGSCFSENIGQLLNDHKFQVLSNPSGILFNPLSIGQCLEALVGNPEDHEPYLLQHDGLFFSYRHHSSIHNADKEALLQKISAERQHATHFLKSADFLIITFGTAYAYHHKQLKGIVANCHKQPGQTFEKILSQPEELVSHYKTLIARLRSFNPGLRIIFTLSPVKHLKDGLVENTLSKSILHLTIQRLVSQSEGCYYFPAYELVTDDLRDYRFYKADLAHPSEQAIQYVWEKFGGAFFSERTLQLNRLIHDLNKALAHRSLNEKAQGDAKLESYIANQKSEIKKLKPDFIF